MRKKHSASCTQASRLTGISLLVVGLLALTPIFSGAAQERFVLAKDGQPAATIVIAADAQASVKLAASELQEYVERISGAKLPVATDAESVSGPRIFVGTSRLTEPLKLDTLSGFSRKLNEEGFLIRTIGNDLVLIGNDTGPRVKKHELIPDQEYIYTGSLFAVYELLERFGCRWYYPGPFGEIVPESKNLSLAAVNETIQPSFPARGFWYGAPAPRRNDPDFNAIMRRWMLRNRFLPYGSVLSSATDGSVMGPFSKMVVKEVDGEKKRVNEMFEEHPEYFALKKDGTRTPGYICLAHPEVLRLATERALQYFRDNPDSNCFGYAPPDGAPTCECEECQFYNYNFMQKEPMNAQIQDISDSFYRFLNKVAEGVKKEFPDKWITSTAYSGRMRPPVATKLGDNISTHPAFLGYAQHHRLDFQGWMTREKAALLKQWAAINPYMVERQYYPVMQFHCNILLPMHRTHAFNVKQLKEMGMAGAEWEGRAAFKTGLLNYYVLGRMLWDVDTDIDALLEEHNRLFYGAAGEKIGTYFDAIEEMLVQSPVEFHEEERLHEIFPYASVVKASDDVGDIESMVAKADEATRQRVRFARLVVDHMRAYVEMRHAETKLDFEHALKLADSMIEIEEELDAMNSTLVDTRMAWYDTLSAYGELGSNATARGKRMQYLAKLEMIQGPRGDLVTALPVEWDFQTDPNNEWLMSGWYDTKLAPNNWVKIETTRCWEGQGFQDENLHGYDGVAWYRTNFSIPKKFKGKKIILFVGGLNNQGWFWVNGQIAGHQPYHAFWERWKFQHQIDITDFVKVGDDNELVIRVKNDSNFGGIIRRCFLYSPRE